MPVLSRSLPQFDGKVRVLPIVQHSGDNRISGKESSYDRLKLNMLVRRENVSNIDGMKKIYMGNRSRYYIRSSVTLCNYATGRTHYVSCCKNHLFVQ